MNFFDCIEVALLSEGYASLVSSIPVRSEWRYISVFVCSAALKDCIRAALLSEWSMPLISSIYEESTWLVNSGFVYSESPKMRLGNSSSVSRAASAFGVAVFCLTSFLV